ncbi:hypothetical protein NBRC116494_19600 [Aurantivibrio plasticivorans]
MANTTESPITSATLRILKALTRILIRNGIAYGTLAELIRKTYVDVGFELMEETGRRGTVSGVSGMTGLTRKETKRLHELQALDTQAADQRYNRAVRVISGWLNDQEFLDDQGQPKCLPLDGHASFSELVKRFSGDIPVAAMQILLSEAKCINETDRGIELVSHAYIPSNAPADKLNILGTDVAELIDTIDHNINSTTDQLRFQRKVSSHRLNPAMVSDFQQLSSEKSQQLLEELDAWLSEREVRDSEADCHYVALGIYYSEKPSDRKD